MKNTAENKTLSEGSRICGRYFRYPDKSAKRSTEGGRRLLNRCNQNLVNRPLITIITVVYNNEQTLERCICSVLNQSYKNIEHIIIDGNSTDQTLGTIKKYNNAISYYVSEQDSGIYDAMNKGLSLARGKSILMLNSDDWLYENNTIASIVPSILQNPTSVVYGRIMRQIENGDTSISSDALIDKNILQGLPIPHPSAFIPASLYNKVGDYDTKYKIAADYAWWVKAKLLDISFINTRLVVSNFSVDGVSSSREGWDLGQLESIYVLLNSTEFKPRDILSPNSVWYSRWKNINASYAFELLAHLKFSQKLKSQFLEIFKAKITIIIPLHNDEKTIKKCLDSVKGQTIINRLEIIIIDTSSDNSLNIVNKYRKCRGCHNIKVVTNDERYGTLKATLSSMANINGEYTLFLYPCDLLPSNACDSLYKKSVAFGSDIIAGKITWSNQSSKNTSSIEMHATQDSRRQRGILKPTILGANRDFAYKFLIGKFYRTALFKKLGPATTILNLENEYFPLRILSNAKLVHLVSSRSYLRGELSGVTELADNISNHLARYIFAVVFKYKVTRTRLRKYKLFK